MKTFRFIYKKNSLQMPICYSAMRITRLFLINQDIVTRAIHSNWILLLNTQNFVLVLKFYFHSLQTEINNPKLHQTFLQKSYTPLLRHCFTWEKGINKPSIQFREKGKTYIIIIEVKKEVSLVVALNFIESVNVYLARCIRAESYDSLNNLPCCLFVFSSWRPLLCLSSQISFYFKAFFSCYQKIVK